MLSLFERLLGDDAPDEQVDLESRQGDANDALRERVDPEVRGIDDCAVTGVAVVNEGPDGEPIVVPIARFSLGEAVEEPDLDLVWELVGEALDALVPAFEDAVFVRHYDVQFTFDGDGLFEAAACRRVAVTPELASRFHTDVGFDVQALREAMLAADDLDDEIAPVAWGECENYSNRQHAAVVTGGVAAAAGASASAASCAGATAGGAGGAC
jgi:hypothetical protein